MNFKTHATLLAAIAVPTMTVGVHAPAAPTFAEAIPQKTESGYQVVFRLDASEWDDKPTSVAVAGDFNGWNAGADVMLDLNSDNIWELTLPMSPGRYGYKFVVDGDRWLTDPTDDSELRIDDGYGGQNSGVVVGPDIRKAPPPEANAINAEFVSHNPVADATPVDEGLTKLVVRALAGDVEAVQVATTSTGGPTILKAARKAGSAGGFDVFEVWLQSQASFGAEGVAEDDRYFFILTDGDAGLALTMSGADSVAPDSIRNNENGLLNSSFASAWSTKRVKFDVPEWTHHAVWYQIFPERFRNGNPDNDPGRFDYENLVGWNTNWWDVLTGETPPSGGSDNFYTGTGDVWDRRYGGDIQGVQEKLGYLKDLGITAIYFNPVFEGESMHKYDTADFRHVDDNFGVRFEGDQYPPVFSGNKVDPESWEWSPSDKVFLEFLKEAKAQGFKVVIDGVFNHVGRAHPLFQDVLENGQDSEYADWFVITDWGTGGEPGQPGGIQWKAWDGPSGHLPTFAQDPELGLAPGPREHIFAITKRWLDPDGDPTTDDGIDGWRLDVPGDIPHPFWVDWRKLVKETNPDAYIVGEIWSWADAWLKGDQFDAVMNYQFAMPTQDFFIDQQTALSPSEFMGRLEAVINRYPRPITHAQQNLMGSHDTDRLASMFVNPDRPYDGANRPQDNAKNFDPPYSERKPNREEWERMRQLVYFQHAFVGAPMTYYGDEAGMWSPDDPSNRQPFPWPDKGPYRGSSDGFDQETFDYFQRAIAIRNSVSALRTGDFQPLLADDAKGIIAFARENDEGKAVVVVNRSDRTQTISLDVSGEFVDLIADGELIQEGGARPVMTAGDAEITLDEITLPAWGTAIYVLQ
ncbi:MAG: alpha-amylase family glycosyl hydrolase [Planctomycetota bacterium]